MSAAFSDYEGETVVAMNRMGHQGRPGPSLDGDSGGGDGGATGDRLKRIEDRLNAIESDQRTHLRFLIGFFVTLLVFGLGATSFLTLRVDRTEDKIARVDERIGRVQTSVSELPGKLSDNLSQLNQTLLQAVLASRDDRPVVVLPQNPPAPTPQP